MKTLVIKNGLIIDGTGSEPVNKGTIIIEGNVIKAVGTDDSIQLPDGEFDVIDAEGLTVLPGFIDCHVHLMFEKYDLESMVGTPFTYHFYQALDFFKKVINAGVTTVRDASGMDLGTKQAIDNGLVLGPRSKISVNGLSITGGHGDSWMPSGINLNGDPYPGMPDAICDGVGEVRKKVREVLRAGAEVIKISATGGVLSPTDRPDFTQFSPEELRVIVQEGAYHGGVKVMAHAQGLEGIRQAVEAGIYSIEHGIYLDDDLIDLFLKKGTYLVPTLLAPVSIVESEEMKEKLPAFMFQKAVDTVDVHKESIARAYQAGVKIAMGTDSGVMEHGQNLRELGLMCEIGMSPMEAILATTKVAAECLEWDDKIGTLEQGKLADIVLVKGNPLDEISLLAENDNIKMVLKDGELVKDIR
ncbi:MAG: amidohydrolase family protein [Anaerolineaceae bacterium]|nr:amidohydrolase family protein [Anaerolineaceae bacterium]